MKKKIVKTKFKARVCRCSRILRSREVRTCWRHDAKSRGRYKDIFKKGGKNKKKTWKREESKFPWMLSIHHQCTGFHLFSLCNQSKNIDGFAWFQSELSHI